MIKITIKTDNQAFEDENYAEEVSRILNRIAKDFVTNGVKESYNDINGNKVAQVKA